MLLSPDDAKQCADWVLQRSKADHCIVKIAGSDESNLRFARGSATTNGSRSTLRVTIESRFGRRGGAASVTGLEKAALEDTVRRSEEVARSAPENPELMAPLGPQVYQPGAGYDARLRHPALRACVVRRWTGHLSAGRPRCLHDISSGALQRATAITHVIQARGESESDAHFL